MQCTIRGFMVKGSCFLIAVEILLPICSIVGDEFLADQTVFAKIVLNNIAVFFVFFLIKATLKLELFCNVNV